MSIFTEWFPQLSGAAVLGKVEQGLDGLEEFKLPKGLRLVFEGDSHSDVMFYVKQGSLKVTVQDRDKEVTITELASGSFVGEMGFLQGRTRSATLTAYEDTVLKIITREYVARMLENASPVMLLMFDQVLDRLRSTSHISEEYLREIEM